MTSNNAQTSKTKNNDRSASRGGATMAPAEMTITYEQIAIRAEHIWRQKGCPGGQDEQNWHEAERQLKKEKGLR